MSSSINNNLSLYIPRVFRNITKERIANVFQDLGFGRVQRVDLVGKEKPDGERYNSAYVHFEEWFDSPTNEAFQERVFNPESQARVVYDDPWFWIVLENKTKKRTSGDRKPRLDISQPPSDGFVPVGRHGRPVPPRAGDFVPGEYAAQLELQNYQLRMTIKHLQMQSGFAYDAYPGEVPAAEPGALDPSKE